VSSDAGKDDDVLLASLKPILVEQRVRNTFDTIEGGEVQRVRLC
jgi:hypothetical protein